MEYFVHLGADSVDAIKQACGTEVEELNVTENGTYNAPSGKAYNPVIVNVESGGGGDTEQWETLFEGNVETLNGGGPISAGNVGEGLLIQDDVIKVTFNGEEYTCNKNEVPIGNAYGGMTPNGPDFSEYPFAIMSGDNGGVNMCVLYTETAGTYSLKIEAQEGGESGGDSDFSTANLTLNVNLSGDADADNYIRFEGPIQVVNNEYIEPMDFQIRESASDAEFTVVLYKNESTGAITAYSRSEIENVTIIGDGTYADGLFSISGDCTINITAVLGGSSS